MAKMKKNLNEAKEALDELLSELGTSISAMLSLEVEEEELKTPVD